MMDKIGSLRWKLDAARSEIGRLKRENERLESMYKMAMQGHSNAIDAWIALDDKLSEMARVESAKQHEQS